MKGWIGAVLMLDIEDIDIHAAVADLGVDSVMTNALSRSCRMYLRSRYPDIDMELPDCGILGRVVLWEGYGVRW
jgi:hypothetical protein